MKAVLVEVTPEVLRRRKATGLDRWDEMWEGVLHMAPAPLDEHQRILAELIAFLVPLLKRTQRGVVRPGIRVFNEACAKEDYRIPDLTFVARERTHLIARDGIRGGGPDAVVEIRSPEDESYEKFPFFAALGVAEVVVVHRDSKRVEVHRLSGADYAQAPADRGGWVVSATLGVRLRTAPGHTARPIVEDLQESLRVEV